MGTSYYHIADTSEVDKMKSLLLHTFESMAEVEDTTTSRFFDTFDWRLHQKGWQLYRQNRHYEIVDQATEKIVTAVGVNDAKKRTFYWDFPDSRFSEILGQTTQMRALLPVADIVRERLRLHLRNGDEKIVARIDIETYGDKENTTTVMRCRPNPVRGYKKELRRVISVIEALSLPEENKNPVLAILERGERHPGDYSSKINIDLQPEMAANQAVRLIMRNLVDVMHINLPGVLDDIDSEFLHDFRVSIRRARSLLGQMKAVLDAETTAALQSRLKTMGGATGEVRDLDVYLLKKSEYTQLVPETLDKGIVQLFQILERKRRYAKNRMVRAMAGNDFAAALRELDIFSQNDPVAVPTSDSESPAVRLPIMDEAKKIIYKRYRRVIKKGREISETTADERLHDLRIDCKKLRYLLEFFSSLFPGDQMKALIRQLKQLQENLGDFNDLSVQQAFLVNLLNTTSPTSANAVVLSAAIGGLITQLATAHKRVRSQFLRVFETFDTPDNNKRFKRLFCLRRISS